MTLTEPVRRQIRRESEENSRRDPAPEVTEPVEGRTTGVRITRVDLWPVSSPFVKPFSMRNETLLSIDSVLIEIGTDAGVVGVADTGNTSPWFQGETQASIVAMIAGVLAPGALLGRDPRNLEAIVARMDVLARDNFQAKALVDMALHDIVGKLNGVPVYDLLGGRSVAASRQGWAMSAARPAEAGPAALRAVAAGYRTLKLKTGHGTDDDDVALVAAVREAVGDDIELFIDVNGRWRYDQAVAMVRRLEPYRLCLIEQPLPPGEVLPLARLRGRTDTPLYADESARDLRDLVELIRHDAVDGLFLKLTKVGGFVKAQRWLALARAAGLPVKTGCMIGCGIEASAYTHLTVSDDWLSHSTHENIGPLLIHNTLDTAAEPIVGDLALEVPRYEGALAYPMEGPGLGVEPDRQLLKHRLTGAQTQVTVTA